MEYMEVSLDSLDLRVKGILSSQAEGECGLRRGHGPCWSLFAGSARAAGGAPDAPWWLPAPRAERWPRRRGTRPLGKGVRVSSPREPGWGGSGGVEWLENPAEEGGVSLSVPLSRPWATRI